MRVSKETTLNWAGFELSESDFQSHCLAIGTTGSGKSIVIKLLMQSLLPSIGTEPGKRAIVYDAKGDAFPLLSSYCDPSRIFTFNPFDERGLAWDIQDDVTEYRIANDVAEALIPEATESQPFFTNAARDILTEVMVVFLRLSLNWSFADLIRMTMYPADCKVLLGRVAENESMINSYFSDPKICSDIFTTLRSKLSAFYPTAFGWEAASQKISLRSFMQSNAILILQNSLIGKRPNKAITQTIFNLLAHLALSKEEGTSERTCFFIDELAEAPKLPSLESLAKEVRSKGGRLILAFQTIPGLRASHLYGNEVTLDLLGNFSNRFVGRLECPETADFVSRLIGDQETIMESTTKNSQGTSSSTSQSFTPTVRRVVLPSQLLSLPPSGDVHGLRGFASIRSHGWTEVSVPPTELFEQMLQPTRRDVKEYIQRDPNTQFSRGWTPEEREHLLAKESLQNPVALDQKGVTQRPTKTRIDHPVV